MTSVQRILPYTKRLVMYALYDVLDSGESEYDKTESGRIDAAVTVYGNRSGFTLSVSQQPPVTILTVVLNTKLNKKKNKENSQNKRKSLIKVNE